MPVSGHLPQQFTIFSWYSSVTDMDWQKVLAVFALLLIITNGQDRTHEEKVKISEKALKLPNDICGKTSSFNQMILGGEDAKLGDFPWMAAIGYTKGSPNLNWMCGGSLITNQYVVTAAHCFIRPIEEGFKMSVVRLGDLNLNESVADNAVHKDFEVDKTIIHPLFTQNWSYNDIGLIKIKGSVTFNGSDQYVRPICLPIRSHFYQTTFTNQPVQVAGWGEVKNLPTTVLKKASVNIKEKESCSNTSRLAYNPKEERIICASFPGRDTCKGDSGGPMMVFARYNETPRLYLLGVVAYGMPCGMEGFPGIYTNVNYFIDWIVENLEL